MSAEFHARLTKLFGEAIELPASERTGLIDRVRQDDPALATELVALLEADSADVPGLATGRLATPPDPGGELVAPAIAGFSMLGVLGKGGMGTVYEARQATPNRLVAIKVLHATSHESAVRFKAEIEIMARLDHPGIAKIFEAGEADGHPYFVMERVEGVTLESRLGRMSRTEKLHTFVAVCDAVQHAHVKGVFHRDLKPSNVMIRDDGRVVVLDFGIARLAAGDNATRAGELMGTPVYMSPEQARLRADEVDARSDVYTLGVILYELMCGQLPYDVRGKQLAAIARTICDEPARPLSQHDRALRGDLEAICDRALQKEPERRYPSAASLADDVRRHLEGVRVSVRVPGTVEQLRRFVRRRPGVAAAILGVVAVAVIVTVLWLDARAAWRTADTERTRVTAAHDTLEERTNQLVLDQARAALATDPTHALALLRTLTPRGVDPRVAWDIVDEAVGRGVAAEVHREHVGEVRWVEPAPGGGYVTGGYDGVALLWRGGKSQVLAREPRRVHVVRPSPDGTMFAIGFDGGLARVVDAEGKIVADTPALAGDVERIAWSPDGTRLALADDRGTVVLWSHTAQDTPVHAFSGIESLSWSASGKVLLVGADNGNAFRLDFDPYRLTQIVVGSEVLAMWADDAHTFAIGADGTVVRDGEGFATGLPSKTAAFSGDGTRAMLGGVDGRVLLVEGTTLTTLPAHGRQVRSVIASSDGQRFATASDDGAIRVWDFVRKRTFALHGHVQRVRQLAFAAGATELLSGDSDGSVRRWELDRIPPTTFEPNASVARVALAVDGKSLVAIDADGEIRRWDLTTGADTLVGQHGRVTAIAAGASVVTASADGQLIWWQTLPTRGGAPSSVRGLASSPDGRFVAAATTTGPIVLFTGDGHHITDLAGHAEGTDVVAFAGKLLVSGGQDRVVRVWDPEQPAKPPIELGPIGGDTRHIVFAKGGSVLAVAGSDGKVLAWNVKDNIVDAASRKIVTEHRGAVIALATDGGDRLVSVGRDRTRVEIDLARGTSTKYVAEEAVAPVEGAWTLRGVPLPIAGGRDIVIAADGKAIVVHEAAPRDFPALRARLQALPQ